MDLALEMSHDKNGHLHVSQNSITSFSLWKKKYGNINTLVNFWKSTTYSWRGSSLCCSVWREKNKIFRFYLFPYFRRMKECQEISVEALRLLPSNQKLERTLTTTPEITTLAWGDEEM